MTLPLSQLRSSATKQLPVPQIWPACWYYMHYKSLHCYFVLFLLLCEIFLIKIIQFIHQCNALLKHQLCIAVKDFSSLQTKSHGSHLSAMLMFAVIWCRIRWLYQWKYCAVTVQLNEMMSEFLTVNFTRHSRGYSPVALTILSNCSHETSVFHKQTIPLCWTGLLLCWLVDKFATDNGVQYDKSIL